MAAVHSRRSFLGALAAAPLLATPAAALGVVPRRPGPKAPKIKLSCNIYSFNEPLTKGTMTLEETFDFCAELGFDAVDPTGYYFPGYPEAPSDRYLYEIKKRAFRLGLDISGTGVRNDFTAADPPKRAAAEATEQVVAHLKECVAYGAERGIFVVLQHHDDLLKTAPETLAVLESVGSEWLGLNVDIGSLRTTDDPYAEIAALAPFAYTWQIKEQVYRKGVVEDVDVAKIVRILRDTGYRGYIPLETLGAGDPRPKLRVFLDRVRRALDS